jgi:hypothetical protein
VSLLTRLFSSTSTHLYIISFISAVLTNVGELLPTEKLDYPVQHQVRVVGSVRKPERVVRRQATASLVNADEFELRRQHGCEGIKRIRVLLPPMNAQHRVTVVWAPDFGWK